MGIIIRIVEGLVGEPQRSQSTPHCFCQTSLTTGTNSWEQLCSADLHSLQSPHPIPASCWHQCSLLFCSLISVNPKHSWLHWTNTEIQSVNLDNPGAKLKHIGWGHLQAKHLALQISHTHTHTQACSLKKSLDHKKAIFKPLIKQTNIITSPFFLIPSWEFKSTILKDSHNRNYI